MIKNGETNTIKRLYKKPKIEIQSFHPDEFVSACETTYEFNCDAAPGGMLFKDVNGSGRLDKGDRVINKMQKGAADFNVYHPCGSVHNVPVGEADFINGFLVPMNIYNDAKVKGWRNLSTKKKRRSFKWSKFEFNQPQSVLIWYGHTDGTSHDGYHATTADHVTCTHS